MREEFADEGYFPIAETASLQAYQLDGPNDIVIVDTGTDKIFLDPQKDIDAMRRELIGVPKEAEMLLLLDRVHGYFETNSAVLGLR
jgi:hypothetical protein